MGKFRTIDRGYRRTREPPLSILTPLDSYLQLTTKFSFYNVKQNPLEK
jgi:hypothetical protein